MTKLIASKLAKALNVRRETISRWHKRKLIVGERDSIDSRRVTFDIRSVVAAVKKHNLGVDHVTLEVLEKQL